MRVELTTDRIGGGGLQHAGEEIDLPDGEAAALIRHGYARPVESAAQRPAETAAKPSPQPRTPRRRR